MSRETLRAEGVGEQIVEPGEANAPALALEDHPLHPELTHDLATIAARGALVTPSNTPSSETATAPTRNCE